ncbi:MAG: hypothetical protein ACXW33_08570 [Sulfuricurvum sp.]
MGIGKEGARFLENNLENCHFSIVLKEIFGDVYRCIDPTAVETRHMNMLKNHSTILVLP